MPRLPVGPPSPYDTLDTILNTARTRVNDAIVTLGGEVLTNKQPFTRQMANTGWRKLQAFLANNGMGRFRGRAVLTGLPVVGSNDPASQALLNWQGYFDGVSWFFPPQYPALPQDLILPLTVGERITGTNARFRPVELCVDGHPPNGRKQGWNGWWDWREDGMYMPGSLYSMDLEVYYAAYLADFANGGALQANATAYAINGNVLTVLVPNNLSSYGGQTVTLAGFGTSTFLNGQILTTESATPEMFTASFTHANAAATEAGLAGWELAWYQQPAPIMRCLSALANYIAAEFAGPRADLDAGTFIAAAEQDARLIYNTEVRQKSRVNVSRRSFSGRNRGNRGGGSGFAF